MKCSVFKGFDHHVTCNEVGGNTIPDLALEVEKRGNFGGGLID